MKPQLLLLCALLSAAAPAGQNQAPPARASKSIQSEATAILVDVVVRDKRGQPVTDLAQSDFEILEDGVPQEIGALTRYMPDGEGRATAAASSAPPPPTTAAPSAAPKAEPTPEPVIALVFDRLTPEARAIATKAALRYIGEGTQSPARMAVFGVDLSLLPYQNYTRDVPLLRKAVGELGERSTAQFESQAGKARDLQQRVDAGASAAATLSAGGQAAAGAAQSAGPSMADAKAAEMQQRTLETFQMLERDQQGYSTSNALLAVVNSMRALPGRKSVIFFSEGVAIPANVLARFRSVINTANTANVSIYTMDAGGLRAVSESKEARDSINAAAARNLSRNPTTDVVGKPMTEDLERNEDLLRDDPHSGLGMLAQETGGILIRNTNDMTGGFKRIDQDMRNYYMLSYVPKNDQFDGKFRTIAVKVKRSGVDVAARKGYYAVRGGGPTPIMSYEARPLAMLEATPLPNAFPVRAAAVKFPVPGEIGLTPVIVSVPASAMTFATTEDKANYRAEFTVVVRFRDAGNEVVDKVSQSYVLTGPIDRLDSVKQGNVLFYRERRLPPGLYTMEAVVHDVLTDRASVRLVTIEEPKPDPNGLRASDLVLVASAERVPKGSQPEGNPFLVGDTLLYPNLGEPLRKGAATDLGFFFTVYPEKGTKVQATLELVQNGAKLAAVPVTLGEPDASGRIQQVSRVAIGALAPGTYELRVVLADSRQSVARTATFSIVN
jgi:VWFA-related protein